MQELSSTISPYLRTFKRKLFLIISFTSITTLAALWLSSKDLNTYVSSFRILLEPTNSTAKLSQASTLTRTEGLPDKDLLNLDYPTQLEILKSSLMLSQISDRVKAKVPEVNTALISQDLRKNLKIERITIGPSRYDWTKIFEITYQGTNHQIVNAVAEATAEQYLEYSLSERQNSIYAGVSFIDEQLPELTKRVSTLQSRQQDLQQQHHLIDPNQKGQELFTQVDELSQRQLNNQTELLELKALADTLQQQLNITPQQAVVVLALNQNPNHQELLRQLQKVEGEIAGESARFTANSPHVLALKEDRQNLVALLHNKIQPIIKQHSISLGNELSLTYHNESFLKLTQQLVDTHNQIEVLRVRDSSLHTSKQKVAKPAQELPRIARQYNRLEQELTLTTGILNQLRTQRETLRVEAAQKDVPWKLLGKAEVIRDADGKPNPFPPNRTKKLLAGTVVGLFTGMGAAILWEKWRNIFYTAEDIQDTLLLPLLGEIAPDDRYKALTGNSSSSAIALLETNRNRHESLFLKSFDALYAELTFLYADNPINSLVVSSVEPKDGQSTIALQLAKTAAAEGKQVLLVDANLDRPQLYAQLNIPQTKSLHGSSVKRFVAQDAIYSVPEVKNLYVLTADALQVKCSSKLWSTRMQDLVDRLSADYDLVIYDAPHFLDSSGVSFLTSQTDGIVLVVGVEKTPQSLVKEAVNQINAFRLPILGVVANHVVSR